MRRVGGLSPLSLRLSRSIHRTNWVAVLTLAAVCVAAARYVGEKVAVYLPDKITITSWKPPHSAARDLAAPEPSQTSNLAKKAAREPFRRHEARLTPQAAEPMQGESDENDAAAPETGRASWYALRAATASGEMMDDGR